MSSIVLDDWQKEILDYDGDILLIKGRRIGGTHLFAIKAIEEMKNKKGTKIVMLSLTEDQAQLIIMMALDYATREYPKDIDRTAKNKPTLNRIILKNKSSLIVRPVGATGEGIRGFDGHILGIDEAPRQPKKMWSAARPILTTNNGKLWMWGTPSGKEGYAWEQYKKAILEKDPKARFKVWHKNSEEVFFNRPITDSWTEEQREGTKRILEEERKSMSDIEYAQEYLGEFMDDIAQFFSEEWIEKVCVLEKKDYDIKGKEYMGVDCSRFGKDESSWSSFVWEGKTIEQRFGEVRKKLDIIEGAEITRSHILNRKVVKCGIDAGAGTIGVSWMDILLRTNVKNKIVAMNNREIVINSDSDNEEKQRMLKNDMYYLVLALGEKGELKLFKDDELINSLRSIQQEIVEMNGKPGIRIFGRKGANGDHYTESIVRGVYLAKKEKNKNLWLEVISI